MSYKPDEGTLAAYLYGELSKEEEAKVKDYLESNPEVKKEVDDAKDARSILGKLQDREVTAPSFVFDDSATVVVSRGGGGFNTFLRSTIAIAASIALLMVTAYATKLNVNNQQGTFQISFGSSNGSTDTSVNEAEVKAWMQETLAMNNVDLINKINSLESDLGEQIKELDAVDVSKSQFVNDKLDQRVIDKYLSQLKAENRNIILNLMEVSTRDQKQYMDELMTDFAAFVQEQRRSDLELIEGTISRIANNSDIDPNDGITTSEE